ncbi:MAG: hypothetical protein QXY45_01770 [Candidatus Aenigmatarchaeota archaeon]
MIRIILLFLLIVSLIFVAFKFLSISNEEKQTDDENLVYQEIEREMENIEIDANDIEALIE